MFDFLDDPSLDTRIRQALSSADNTGRLADLASRIGIAGGEQSLREIMASSGPLSIMDRGMLSVHLGLVRP